MFTSPVPLMVIRSDGPALVEVNGALLGECACETYAAMPVAGDGCYYISVFPLTPLRYAVTRRVCFSDGILSDLPRDISACAWPGSVYEFTLACGGTPEPSEPPTGELKTALDFLYAVRAQDKSSAMALMHAELIELVDVDALCAFFGSFTSAKPPIADSSGKYIGLLASERESLMSARLYEFEYRDGLIYNVTEL